MSNPLMPKATAVWLIDNTSLSFTQISNFCGIHLLEVQALADGETTTTMVGFDPIASGQLTLAEVHRCELDSNNTLNMSVAVTAEVVLGKKKGKYTPIARRADRPDSIAWLVKYYPGLTDGQIAKIVNTTKNTIQAVRQKNHWNSPNIKPRSPVQLGFCSQSELDGVLKNIKPTTAVAQ